MTPGPVAPGAYRDRVPPLAPFAAALNAFESGDAETELRLRSSLGEDEILPVEFFFRTGDALLSFERYALALCRGRVLDLGAGAGPHTLALQAAGLSVVAVEISSVLVRLQRRRGVHTSVCADFRYWWRSGFDTVLMLMNGLGPVGTLRGLDRFLSHARRFLAPGGAASCWSTRQRRSTKALRLPTDGPLSASTRARPGSSCRMRARSAGRFESCTPTSTRWDSTPRPPVGASRSRSKASRAPIWRVSRHPQAGDSAPEPEPDREDDDGHRYHLPNPRVALQHRQPNPDERARQIPRR